MRVHIERRFDRQVVDLYFYEAWENGARQLVCTGADEWRWEDLPVGARAEEPSLRLPTEALERIVEAAGDFLPASAAADRHLADTIVVRDRLLALVEKKR